MSRASPEGEFVEALARGLAVIEAFDEAHPEMTLSEVARRAGVTPATARRSLHTLAALGYVRCVRKRFLLSARILMLGSAYLRAGRIDEALMPELRRIVSLFGDAASVSILEGTNILYIAHLSEQRAVRPIAGVGVTYPAYATSMGRVLLSGLCERELEACLAAAPPRRLTEFTETDPLRLREIIAAVRRQGYATVADQLAYGVTAIAVPVRGDDGGIIAALNSSGYTGLVTEKDLVESRLAELRLSAGRIAEALRRHPTLRHSLMRLPAGNGADGPSPREALRRSAD